MRVRERIRGCLCASACVVCVFAVCVSLHSKPPVTGTHLIVSTPTPAAHLEVQAQLCEHLHLEVDKLLVQRLGLLGRADRKHLPLAELVHAVQALAWGGG